MRDTDLEQAADAYGLGRLLAWEEVHADHVFRLRTERGIYALRLHPSEVTTAHLQAQHALQRLATDAGVPCCPPLRDLGGPTIRAVGGRLADVAPWVDHDAFFRDRPEHRICAAHWLARFHDAVASVRRMPLAGDGPWRSPAEVARRLEAGTGELRRDAERLNRQAAVREAAQAALMVLERIGARLDVVRTPFQASHGDYGGRNVLLCGGDVAAILDFGRSDMRPRLYDLAWVLFFEFLGDDPTERHWRFAQDCCRAYAAASSRPVTAGEWHTLPYLLGYVAAYGVADAAWEKQPTGEALAFGQAFPLVRALLDGGNAALRQLVGDACGAS